MHKNVSNQAFIWHTWNLCWMNILYLAVWGTYLPTTRKYELYEHIEAIIVANIRCVCYRIIDNFQTNFVLEMHNFCSPSICIVLHYSQFLSACELPNSMSSMRVVFEWSLWTGKSPHVLRSTMISIFGKWRQLEAIKRTESVRETKVNQNRDEIKHHNSTFNIMCNV